MKNNTRETRIPGYIPSLDGLRALSLMLIVMYHTWQQSWIPYNLKISASKNLFNFEVFQRHGYIAIDTFFVLTGFCLFYPIARSMFGESKFTGWKQFFIKRARRIYPSYILMLIILLIFPALSYVTYDLHSFKDVAKHLVSHLLFIHTWNEKTLGSMISTAWTMGIECQFYMLFPLLCIPFRKKPVATFAGMAVFAQMLRLFLVSYAKVDRMVIQALTPAYFDVFGWGMISAYFVVWFRHKIKNTDCLKPYMTAISAICVFCAVCYIFWLSKVSFPKDFNGNVYFRYLYRGLFSALIAGFIFTSCFSYSFWEKKIWGNKIFVFFSSISYTVYLWHQNIYIFLKHIHIPYTTADPVMSDRAAMEGMTLLCLASSIIIGVIVTKYIETPIVKYGFKGCFVKVKEKLNIL